MSGSEHLAAARRIRAALDQAADALIHARLEGLLTAERELAAAVAAWPPGSAADPSLREPLRGEMQRLRAGLARCRRLGAGLDAFAGASAAPGGTRGYDRRGAAHWRAASDLRALEASA